MDVSEFLRINAKESSLQMERSSGDGEDAPASHSQDPICSLPFTPSPATAPLMGNTKPPQVPPSGDLAGVRNIVPYKIDMTPKVVQASVKKNKYRMVTPLKSSLVRLNVVNELGSVSPQAEDARDKHRIAPSNVDEKNKNKEVASSTKRLYNTPTTPIMNRVSDLVKTLPKEAVMSPLNYDLLNAPPVDINSKEKIYMSPKPDGVPTSKHSSIKYTQLSRKVYKEPKFVPYEPYKGCSDPIFGGKSKKKTIKKEFALTSQPALPEVPAPELPPPVHKDTDRKAREKLEVAVQDFEAERAEWDKRVKQLTARCEQQEHQLAACRRDNTSLEDQLNVQAKVNGELKKLLVACVGEEVQGRVHCLTEDKARMATMIRRYSEKLDRDYEERERMTILCDVWKSKFLASSVLVEELGSWKAALLRWTAEAAEALTVLLDERGLVRSHTTRAHRLVSQLVTAFDPLHAASLSTLPGVRAPADGVSVSLAVAEQAQALHQRLLGPLLPPSCPEQLPSAEEDRTPGEKMAMQVLERRDVCVGYPGYAGGAGGPRVPQGHPLHTAPSTFPPHMTVNCCAHCNGDIQLV